MSLLERVGVIEVPATKERFVAAEKFVVGEVITWMSPEFKELILGIIEPSMSAEQVRVSRLVESSVDGPILAELGERAKIALAQYYSVLEQLAQKARDGEQIPFWLICYVVDERAFSASWCGGGSLLFKIL